MKFYNNEKIFNLHKDILNKLNEIRISRNFNVSDYIDKKVSKLNKYMSEFGLKSCVIAISGGIDSAVTYAIVNKAMNQKNSPIKKIVPIFIPVYKSEGATNQEQARLKAEELVNTYNNNKLIEIDISNTHKILKNTVDESLSLFGEPWASGQLVSYLRTPTIYYVTSLMSQIGFTPIVCGTTNKDEGAYLGYFGKASDGMVDVQMISDIHKSEVYKVAKYLNVPHSIMEAIPTGDMYDNRNDEEVFGATYEFVELYLHFLKYNDFEKELFINNLSNEAKEQFLILRKNLDDLHKYNKHKYIGASPAVHLDVIESKFNGGWIYNVY